MAEFRPSNEVKSFIRKHMDHVSFAFQITTEFPINDEEIPVGYEEIPVGFAKCEHDMVEMRIKLQPGRDTS